MASHLHPAIIILALALLPTWALAGIVKGPFLQDARPDRVTVALETDADQACSVSWGTGLGNRTLLLADGIHHEAVIEGLQPSTCYAYQAECDGLTAPAGSFCSAPQGDEPFRFVVLGDTRSDHEAHAAVIQAVAAEGVDFVINTGDLVSNGGDEADWVPFFEIEAELLRDLPLYPVVGNHDESGGEIVNYARLFAPPTESSGNENYYSFRYGNALFLVLDNQAATLGRPEDDSQQGRWLLSELESSANDASLDHTFVLVHANMYSADDGRSGDEGLRQWRDLFVEHGVDLVFSGHDHHYARGEADNGLSFVVAGGGGAPLYDFRPGFAATGQPLEVSVWGWLPEPGDKPFTLIWTRKIHHYVLVEIQSGRFKACTKAVIPGVNSAGVAFDCWSTGHLDPGPGPDDPGPGGSGCATADHATAGGLWLIALGWLWRRRRG
jgi:predicted phosphodiesterase